MEVITTSIKIDPEFQSLIPPLTEDEFKQLEKNILNDKKIIEPLTVWEQPGEDQILLDGHNRLAIATKHSMSFEINRMTFDNRDAVKKWIIKHQLGRRNINTFQRGELILLLEPLIHDEAEKRMKAGKADPKQNSAEGGKGQTRDELARLAGVSHDTIEKVKTIKKKGSDDLSQVVREGKMSINSAATLLSMREDAQKQIISGVKAGDIPKNKVTSVINAMSNTDVGTKKCSKCGRELPLNRFEVGRNLCKDCRNIQKHNGPNGYEIIETVNSWFESGDTALNSVDKVVKHFNDNFDKYLSFLVLNLKHSEDIIKDPQNATAISEMFDRAIGKMREEKEKIIRR